MQYAVIQSADEVASLRTWCAHTVEY